MTDVEDLEARVRFLEKELREARWTYLDSQAQAALASGRYAASQCYEIAQNMWEARKKHVLPG